jgi:hypothetical protein
MLILLAVLSHQFPRESWMAPSLVSTHLLPFYLAHPWISKPELSGTDDRFYNCLCTKDH